MMSLIDDADLTEDLFLVLRLEELFVSRRDNAGKLSLGDSSIVYRVTVPTKPMAHFGVQRILRKEIKEEYFEKNSLLMFPLTEPSGSYEVAVKSYKIKNNILNI